MSEPGITLPAGTWAGDAPPGDLTVYPVEIAQGAEPGWVAVSAWRDMLPGELCRELVAVRVRADVLPEHLRPGWRRPGPQRWRR